VLLDTHIWIWAAEDMPKLGARTRRQLNKASRGLPGGLLVSSASAFEIAALSTAGRLRLSLPVDRWIRETVERGNLRIVEVDRDIAVDAGMVPSEALPDPFDRCLVATAREYGVPLVTCDRRIVDYARRTNLVNIVDGSV